MKLFNNSGEFHRDESDRPRLPYGFERRYPHRPFVAVSLSRDEGHEPQFRLPVIEADDLEESQDPILRHWEEDMVNFENVDVQAILFYGYTGKRCFPSVKAF
jgi:hypothetical protein